MIPTAHDPEEKCVNTSAVPTTRGTPLTERQLADLRAQLEQQRRFRLDQLAALRGGDARHGGEIAATLRFAAEAALADVTDALRRMAQGSYGSCTECGTDLPAERLEVLPQVGRCASCLQSAQQ